MTHKSFHSNDLQIPTIYKSRCENSKKQTDWLRIKLAAGPVIHQWRSTEPNRFTLAGTQDPYNVSRYVKGVILALHSACARHDGRMMPPPPLKPDTTGTLTDEQACQ